jgi:hypothetical protein
VRRRKQHHVQIVSRFKLTREEKTIECHVENVKGLLTCEEEKINIKDAKRWLPCEEDGSEIMLKKMQGDDCF